MANVFCTHFTFIALFFIVSADSLDINVQPQLVRPNDENVVFTCAAGNDSKQVSEKMLRIRLMKLNDEGQWTEVAGLRFDGTIDMADANATAVGHMGDVLDSHLTVTWPMAPDDINGIYRCDAIMLTGTGDVAKEQSRDLDVKGVSDDLLLLSEQLKKFKKRLVVNVYETVYSAMESSKTNLLSVLDSRFGDLKEYLDNKTAVSIRRPEEDVEEMFWPEGIFTLLMPSAGCPLRPAAWVKSFHRFKAHPGDKYYPIDVPLHLASPHKKNGFIYRQFCTLPATPERTEPWPAGSYCLFNLHDCPPEFTPTSVKVKVLYDKHNFFLYYFVTLPPQKSGDFSVLNSWYCCRHDGRASTPIQLPAQHPFYLFRHGGRCQEVKGMDVIQDVFMTETVDDADHDKWTDNNTHYRPDVSFKPFKEELCYYSRRKM